MTLEHIASRDGKLLTFLRGEMGLSGGLIRRLKWRSAYRVMGAIVHTDYRVRAGDRITVEIDEPMPAIPAEEGALSILYEDDALIALDKPAGMIVHPTFHRNEGTLANRVLGYYQRTGQQSAIHLVNRLDRDTFGVVLMAKNAFVHACLCEMMRGGAIEKVYYAAVFGTPHPPQGAIDQPIARLSPTSLLRCVRGDGKQARSLYSTLRAGDGYALLRLHPITGRTHQLRVHCAHVGHPILGDAQYGTEASLAFSALHGVSGQQLCAASLSLPHPITGKPLTVRSEHALSGTYLRDWGPPSLP